ALSVQFRPGDCICQTTYIVYIRQLVSRAKTRCISSCCSEKTAHYLYSTAQHFLLAVGCHGSAVDVPAPSTHTCTRMPQQYYTCVCLLLSTTAATTTSSNRGFPAVQLATRLASGFIFPLPCTLLTA
ncbi:unnamed protein product, partial [Ectocarpus sp. 8 AP-2014]